MQAAVRELLEETGHRPVKFRTADGQFSEDLNTAVPLQAISYIYERSGGRPPVRKSVILYLAEAEFVSPIQDVDEVEAVEWFPATAETAELLHFDNAKQHYLEHILPYIA